MCSVLILISAFPVSKSRPTSSSFVPYRVTHFILSFNCTNRTSLKTTKLTGQEMTWPAVSKQALHLRTHSHKNTLTHTSGFSFRCLSLYIFPVHPYTHNSLFIPSKSVHARPQSPRPNRPMNRNMSSA